MDLLHAMSSVSLSFYFPFYLQLLRKMTWWDFRCIFKDNPSRRPENSSSSSNCFSALYFPLTEHWKKEEYHMREVQLSHTVSSHGTTVARTHLHDWLIFILLIIIELILNIIHPFYRFVGKDMMTDLKYPMKPNTVPIWAVPMYAALLPLMIFFFLYYRRRDVYDLHHAILGLFYALLVTAVITDSVKLAVGRPRPDFFWRCFPNGKEVYNALGDVVCHGDKASIKEGHKSFPSGHTSWSFAGLGFLSLYLGGKIKVFDRRGHVAKLCVVLLPILFACFVAISRVDDYWHHWTDVFTGGLIGFVVSLICYLQFFPLPHHHQGWGPYAYFRVLEELQESARAADSANSHNALVTEGQFENEHRAGTGNGFMGLHIDRNSNSQDLETGTGR